MPSDVRADWDSWAQTTAMEANTQPTPQIAAPSATDPAVGNPTPTRPTAIRLAMTAAAPATRRTAAAGAANLPVTTDPNSSTRPDSSSARVWRLTVRMLINAIRIPAVLHMRQAVSPPVVSVL
jgi:hypothetical protein